MTKTIALIGKTNVGKSSLFNRLTQSRQALILDQEGVTRDRLYGIIQAENHQWHVIDAPGFTNHQIIPFASWMDQQLNIALQEADGILWVVESTGPTIEDFLLADRLRQQPKPILLILNKADKLKKTDEEVNPHYWAFPHQQLVSCSAATGQGLFELIETLITIIPSPEMIQEKTLDKKKPIRVTILGRPNVGKSTLINQYVQQDRLLTSNQPGTTVDTILVPFSYQRQQYELVDTAGIRKRSRKKDLLEQVSISKSLHAIQLSDVVILLIDGQDGFVDQDLQLARLVISTGRVMVIAINKMDCISALDRDRLQNQWQSLNFLHFADLHWVSGQKGTGTSKIWQSVRSGYRAATSDYATSLITELLEAALIQHQPPMIAGRRIKLRYAHLGQKFPLSIIIHGKQTAKLPQSYQRYLQQFFMSKLKLRGVPLRLVFRTDTNPYQTNTKHAK